MLKFNFYDKWVKIVIDADFQGICIHFHLHNLIHTRLIAEVYI